MSTQIHLHPFTSSPHETRKKEKLVMSWGCHFSRPCHRTKPHFFHELGVLLAERQVPLAELLDGLHGLPLCCLIDAENAVALENKSLTFF